jgi:hypothetical protein
VNSDRGHSRGFVGAFCGFGSFPAAPVVRA